MIVSVHMYISIADLRSYGASRLESSDRKTLKVKSLGTRVQCSSLVGYYSGEYICMIKEVHCIP